MTDDNLIRAERFVKRTLVDVSDCQTQLGGRTSRADLEKERLGIQIKTLRRNQETRDWLMPGLVVVSLIWLIFTGFIVCCLAFGYGFLACHLSDVVATAFITTSLATVLGLPAIGLHYFFSPKS